MTIAEKLSRPVKVFDGLLARAGSAVGINTDIDGKGEKEAQALVVVRRYSTLSFVGGLVPFSYIDLALISGSQLAMIAEISAIYGVPFRKEPVKAVVAALLGSVVPQGLAAGVAGSAIKSIPIFGQVAGMVLMPTFAASFAWALGKVFIEHFEAGGTLLDLDPEALKAYFKEQFDAKSGAAASPAAEAAPVAADKPAAETRLDVNANPT